MSENALLLICGHYAQPKERLRYGPEKWCDECCCWREEENA